MTIKKQIFLSLTGLTIVIVLLVGVSYSLTDYTQVPNNTIAASNMVFEFDKSNVMIKGKRPISYEEMTKEVAGNSDNNSMIINFRVNAYNTLPNGQNFKVSLYLDKEKAGNDLLDDSVLYAQIIPKKITPGYSMIEVGINEEKSFGTNGKGAPLTGLNEGNEIKLLAANVHTAAPDAYQTFEIRIWLDSSKVIISDTVNRDNNNRALDSMDIDKNLIAANPKDVGKIVYRTHEFNEKMTAIKVVAVEY